MHEDGINVGVLFAQSGSLACTEQALLAGTLIAIDEINGAGGIGGRLIQPIIEDPGPDDITGYRELARKLVVQDQAAVIFGGCSSASRKAVLPILERHGGVLFYPSVYEGFEYSPNVIYTGATSAQTVVPLVRHLFRHHGRRFYLAGSDYVFPREVNRIVREFLLESEGTVAGEDYLPLNASAQSMSEVAERIRAAKPDVVFCTVVGGDTARFYELCHEMGAITPERPAASLTASEVEIAALKPRARAGHLTVSAYFAGQKGEANERFTQLYQARYGEGRLPNVYAAAGYSQVHLFARAAPREGEFSGEELVRRLRGVRYASPQGEMEIDLDTHHTSLAVRIGRSRDDGGFDIVWEDASIVQPDPYMVAYERKIV